MYHEYEPYFGEIGYLSYEPAVTYWLERTAPWNF